MKKFILFVLLVSMFVAALPALAQSSPAEPDCDIKSLLDLLDRVSTSIKEVKDGKPTDPLKVSDFLQTLANAANKTRAYCDGLAFTGDKQLVIGPVTIPEGLYRAKATTTGYMAVQVDAISGECGVGVRMSATHLFILSKGEGDKGAEAVFNSKGCDALITVDNVQTDWQLAFERISTD